MDQLQTGYFQDYGEQLPFTLYMSLYNSRLASGTGNVPSQSEPIAEPKTTAALGEDVTRQKKSKTKDVTKKEGRGSIFREAYHAQLREVHGANMRAVEALQVDGEEFTGSQRKRVLDHDSINSLMEDVIRDIAAEGELVTKEKCSEAAASICTLYELGQSLAGLKNKKHYEELHLGPLCKLPLIHRLFKIDSNTKDDDIHQIETVDILKQLRVFRKQQTKPKIDLAEFMKYLADHYSCDSPYELGIVIKSVGLPISILSKVSRGEHTVLEQAREVIQREMEEETYERLRKIKKSVMEQMPGSFSSCGSLDLRKKYMSMPAAEVTLEVFSNAEGMFTSKIAKHIQSFLLQVSCNRLAKALFQLAICGGSLAVPQDLVPKDKTSNTTEQTKDHENHTTTYLPSEDKVKQFLKDSLSSQSTATTLASMAALERKLIKHFQVKDFLSLQQGNFLEFLVKHIQLLQETLGSTLILGSSGMDLAGSGFRPSRQDMFEFISQCGDFDPSDPDTLYHIESALRSHYRLRDSRELGYGSLQMLAGLVQRQRALAGGGLSQVYYESALFAKQSHSSPEAGCEAVGRLGEMSKAQALASLLSCPLLENLSEWSQWDLIFKPLHGSLRDFIEKKRRITTHTGDKLFSSAAMNLDSVGTAGHLVSMVVADGIVNAPTALLANHMQSSLAAAVAQEDLSQAEEDVSCYSRVATFFLACLTRIPTRTCRALLQQVFLEPFSRVLGQAKSKQILITVAQSDPSHMNCLHRLGILLGITDWVKDYQKKLNPQQSQNSYTAPLKHAKCNLTDSESGSLSALNMSEDEYLEDNVMDNSFASSTLNQSTQQVNGEEDLVVEEEEEEEDDEEMYELASLPNGEISGVSSEAEGGEEEQQSQMSDSNEKDAAGSQSETTSDLKRALIEDIRKSEFGIGVELNAEGQKLMQVHSERLGRSLDRLSTELYSKDTHFVLELIQNADDNSYPSEVGVVPALAFVVERDCITVLNNETGFQDGNIKAICDVGRSTKGKHKYGYIGQKGIGFKSVFKVTDCPEIHSNGFHLRFDKSCGPMGYIPPWMEDERPLDTQLLGNQHSWTTKICLPLRSESHQTRNLFHDVHPSLLLFLHRLRSISIYNQSEKRFVTMTRKDLTMVQPKKIKENVDSTELALAFQLDSSLTEGDIVCQPQKQPVFAYLPLRSFGFRFIIQGDFDIPSSREDVDRDSSWNQWLRSEIPQLFLKAMDVFTDHPEFKGLKGLCHFLQFVPLPDEVMDFFKPVAGQIIQMLKGKAFLPTLSSDGTVVYKLPSQVAVCQDAVIRDVIGGDELERHLSLSYLHPGLSPAPPASLLTHLGVRYLRGSDVTSVTTAMAKLLMEGTHSDGDLHQLAKLLVCNYRALEHGYGEADSILKTLRDLPIIPLADGRVVALSGEGVFFPMEETTTKKKKGQAQTGPLSALYKDVNVVHPSLLSCVEPLESQQVRELLRRLGVHDLEPQQLLEQHIYPTIQSNKWKSKPEAVLVSYLVFIKLHSTSSQEYSDTAVPVLTTKGLLCPANERVHFSEEYGNINLPKNLPGCDWVLLSPCYVQTDGDVAGWRELFSTLGVRDGLIIRKERQTLTAKELASSPWSVESAMWHQKPGEGFVLDDHPCEEFRALATAQLPEHLLLQQRTALMKLLATNWDTGHRYSQYIKAQVLGSDGHPVKSTKSSFYHFLCNLEWVPAYRPLEGDQQDRKYLRPNSVYLASREVIGLLGTHVCYVEMDPSEFSRTLGMRQSISEDDLINYLKKWCVKDQEDGQDLEGADFTSTVEHIHNVYSYLHEHCNQYKLKELFQHNPAVFMEHKRNDGWCSGRFYHLKDVCWSDPTGMFQRYRPLTQGPDSPVQQPNVLGPFYSPLEGMKPFFTRLLNVDLSPNMKQYVGLLEVICSSSPIPTAEVLQDVSVLYARLAQSCKMQVSSDPENTPQSQLNHGYCSTLKGMVSDKRVFPPRRTAGSVCSTCLQQRRRWLPGPRPGSLVRQLRVNEPTTTSSFNEGDRLLFLEICGIRPLSRCVTTEPQTENLRPCPPMQSMKIKRLSFGQVGKLYILYQLEVVDSEEPVVELVDVICLLKDEKELYNPERSPLSQAGHLQGAGELFCTESNHRKELMHFLSGLITSLDDERSLKSYLAKEDIRELPSEEELWEVPEPPNQTLSWNERQKTAVTYANSGLFTAVCGDIKEQLLPGLKDAIKELLLHEFHRGAPSPPTGGWGANAGLLAPESIFAEHWRQPHWYWEEHMLVQAFFQMGTHLSNVLDVPTGQADNGVVDAVMKMWPPPAGPKDRDPELDRGSSHGPPKSPSSYEDNQSQRSMSRLSDQPGPQRVLSPSGHPAAGTPNTLPPSERSQQSEAGLAAPRPAPSLQSAPPAEPASQQPAPNSLAVPDAVVLPSMFQGAAEFQRPPLNLDFPLWNKLQPPHATLEDMELTCQRPTTVVLSEDPVDASAIGEWGEQLVNSFLCHWRDSADPGRPTHTLWCNNSGESGTPYDFKLTFGPEGGPGWCTWR
ncbi:hypothetical protein KUCAC02_000109 [Chaenocephalus aceratus]|nr:hypothetical protein KUCAC02_000109 [Chaenocephalus aceratus]